MSGANLELPDPPLSTPGRRRFLCADSSSSSTEGLKLTQRECSISSIIDAGDDGEFELLQCAAAGRSRTVALPSGPGGIPLRFR